MREATLDEVIKIRDFVYEYYGRVQVDSDKFVITQDDFESYSNGRCWYEALDRFESTDGSMVFWRFVRALKYQKYCRLVCLEAGDCRIVFTF